MGARRENIFRTVLRIQGLTSLEPLRESRERERAKPRGARSRRTWRKRWKRKRKRVCGRKTERAREGTHGVRVRERVVYGRGKRVTEGRRIARKRRRRRRGRERTLQNVQPV